MGEGMNGKLRSRRGASVIAALLLFMVCAVVGAVVLTAGSAAAGRVSKLAEADQRYFSVTSAAELLEKTLTDKDRTYTVTRTETRTETHIKEVELKKNGDQLSETTSDIDDTDYSWSIKDGKNNGSLDVDPTLLAEAALIYVFGPESAVRSGKETAWNATPGAAANIKTWDEAEAITLTPVTESGDPVDDALAVTVKVELKASGDLVFTLWNTDGDPYKLRLTLRAVVTDDSASPAYSTETTQTTSTVEVTTGENAGGNKVTTTTTTVTERTKTTTISWVVDGVSTVSA